MENNHSDPDYIMKVPGEILQKRLGPRIRMGDILKVAKPLPNRNIISTHESTAKKAGCFAVIFFIIVTISGVILNAFCK